MRVGFLVLRYYRKRDSLVKRSFMLGNEAARIKSLDQ